MAKLTVNGIEVEVPNGVGGNPGLRAGWRRNPALSVITSGCRSREIAGCAWSRSKRRPSRWRRAPIPVAEGMVVKTDTPMVRNARRGVMEFSADQPSARLPDLRSGRRVRPAGPGVRVWDGPFAVCREQAGGQRQVFGPLIKTVMTRCIHCTRCIRFSSEDCGGAGDGCHRAWRERWRSGLTSSMR